ncbi:6521_t:CDS:2 [Acaulospora colombiana]|uniref:6521_t:CDS:1 n=1 Tax=Acaulospora colombiana TaxID=27376 RepID=A0ACA9KPQ8_9GLOM|nr:6521_t:CDS:2 [Acaulospora colombiana]
MKQNPKQLRWNIHSKREGKPDDETTYNKNQISKNYNHINTLEKTSSNPMIILTTRKTHHNTIEMTVPITKQIN